MAAPPLPGHQVLVRAKRIFAGDPPRPGPTSMLLEGEWISRVGEGPVPPNADVVDLGELAVIPGFVDSHYHMLCLLPTAGWADLRSASSLDEARRMLAHHATRVREGRWLVGWGFDAMRSGGRLRRTDLDAISPERPALVVDVSQHQGSMNSAALAAVGWGRTTPRWPGGKLERDRRGEPNGIAWERAFGVPLLKAIEAELEGSLDPILNGLQAIAADLHTQGVTHVAEALTPRRLTAVFEAARLPTGVTMMPASDRGLLSPPYDALDGPKTGEGDRRLAVGPVKVVADGAEQAAIRLSLPTAFGVITAALRHAVSASDQRGIELMRSVGFRVTGATVHAGIPHYSRAGLTDITAAALERGFRAAVHALGNEAVAMALDAYEAARRSTGIDTTGCRIEHAMFTGPREFERAARLGLTLSMQPGHAIAYGPTVRSTGLDAIFQPVAIRWALEAGCAVAISSDAPTIPSSALENLRAAVHRTDVEGHPIAPGQAIPPIDALRAATAGGAEACGLEDVTGSLESGKQADFAVLSGDPFDPSTTVEQTWIAGRKVWPA